GNFLVEAAHRLLSFGKRSGLSGEEITTLMQRNIWGFDPDPVSCFLAEMQLRALGTGGEGAVHYAPGAYPLGLFGFQMYPCVQGERRLTTCFPAPLEGTETTMWHIHQADGLALPWGEEPCVDLFLANLPYLAAKN